MLRSATVAGRREFQERKHIDMSEDFANITLPDDIQDILKITDHTLLSPTATREDIFGIVDDGAHFGTASVCIPPCYVKDASEYAKGRVKICTVIGFPLGYASSATKVYEAIDAVENGADEVDMVVNLGLVKSGRFAEISEEIASVKRAVGDKVLKVIIETCLLTKEEKLALCRCVSEAGADFIKTSTGFSTGGATPEDVALLREGVDEKVRVKASGGIASLDDAKRLMALGADRLGTSRLVAIAKGKVGQGY